MDLYEMLNSSSDSYMLHDENPRTHGNGDSSGGGESSGRLFAPNSSLVERVCFLKCKLKIATRRANIYYVQLNHALRQQRQRQQEIDELKNIKNELFDSNSFLSKTLMEKNKEIELLKQDMSQCEDEIADYEKHMKELDQKLKSRKAEQKAANEKYEATIKALQEELSKAQRENSQLIDEIKKTKSDNLDLKEKCEILHSDLKASHEDYYKLRKNMSQYDLCLELFEKLKNANSEESMDFESFKAKMLPPHDNFDIYQSVDWILKAVFFNRKHAAIQMDEAKQKVKVAEEKLNRQIARYELLVNENHSLKVDLVKAEKKAKEAQGYCQTLMKANDELEKTLKSYKFAQSNEYATLTHHFDKALASCYDIMFKLLSAFEQIYHSSSPGLSENNELAKYIERLDPLKLGVQVFSPRDFLEIHYLEQKVGQLDKFNTIMHVFYEYISLRFWNVINS